MAGKISELFHRHPGATKWVAPVPAVSGIYVFQTVRALKRLHFLREIKIWVGCVFLLVSFLFDATQNLLAYNCLPPYATWDNPPMIIVDELGMSSIKDGDGAVTRVINAITSPLAWNDVGTLIRAQKG